MELLKRNHVKYALYMGVVQAVCLLLMEITGQNQTFDQKNPLILFSMIIAPFIIWFLGIREKKRMLKGNMTFKEGFTEGFKISLVYGIISPFIFLGYYLFINPEIIEYVRTAYNLTGAEDVVVYAVDMLIQFVSAIIFGSLYAAIIAFILKSKTK